MIKHGERVIIREVHGKGSDLGQLVSYAGTVLSLLIALFSIGYSAGNLGTRVTVLESGVGTMQTKNDTRDTVLSRIDSTLARIDEQLRNIKSQRGLKNAD